MAAAPKATLTVAMVAGETSGDNLGAALINALEHQGVQLSLVGLGGPAMIARGFPATHDIETLSVNGFVDPFLRLPRLIKLLRDLRDEIIAAKADCFVGIDSNFFNLLLAGMLKKRGVKTVQYVSPTVWAWRQGRVKRIRRAVDLMLTLYPFETAFYEENQVPVRFVGHPKADEFLAADTAALQRQSREQFDLAAEDRAVAILPGSRGSEVKLTGVDFLAAAALIADEVDRFLIPAANERRLEQLHVLIAGYPALTGKVTVQLGASREMLAAADVVLVNSGTATLEAMLLRKPMVMSYRLGKITYGIVSRLVHTDWFALPNILAQETLIPEFIQDAATPDALAAAVRHYLQASPAELALLHARFDDIHATLRQGEIPGSRAAHAVTELCHRSI